MGALTFTTTQARVDIRVMAMKGYSTFPKDPELTPPHHCS